MNLLRDTHAFIWLMAGAPELSARAHAAATDPDNQKWISVVSLWEITIKVGLGKLPLHVPLEELLGGLEHEGALGRLDIKTPHMLRYAQLPFHHRDPFAGCS